MAMPGRREILLGAALLAGAVLLAVTWKWVDTIPLGIAFAVVLAPLHHRLARRLPWELSALLVTLLVLCITAAGVFLLVTVMQENLATNEGILRTAAEGAGTLANLYAGLGVPPDLIAGVMDVMQGIVGTISRFWSGLSPDEVLLTWGMALLFAALFLSLLEGDRVLRWLLRRMPPEWLGTYHRLAAVSVAVLYSVLVVHLVMVALTFALALPFYWLLGYGHVLSLSVITALCELVPVLGASVPMIILLLYTFAIGDLRGFLLVFLIGYLLVSLLPELTVRPILMGRRAQISPVIMFFGFMGGILLLGTSGFLLGPLILAVAVSWWRIRKEQRAAAGGAP
jgi:predicted PurR-regulated permease PerM